MIDVAVLGRIGYDLISEEPGVPLKDVRRFSRYLGGSSANVAVGLSRLGARVGIIAALGTDALSDYLLEFLQAEKVDTTHVRRVPGYLPSLALTEVTPPDHFPQVFYRHDPVDVKLEIGEAELEYLSQARMFVTNGTSLCASPSRESTYLALERAKAAGARVVLDVDYRPMSWRRAADAGLAVRLALPFVSVLIGNDIELKLVAGTESLEEATQCLREAGLQLLVSKLGAQGTRVWAGAESWFLEPYPVEVQSTIGAGDGFAAGFLWALLDGRPLQDCLRYGNAAAAIVVSRLSCSEAMPTRAEIEALIGERLAHT
ncbi:MAG: 5-dehydro-2-deoxygluconokinase [Bryobacterales bacterium]|nr:5-dehydro-2-deoxygluconokinase [Bryobacteraceae bacterium]MDW8353210.1 5-dehydro-2-deoxygluconokinase [Bryobacterales bacterium]